MFVFMGKMTCLFLEMSSLTFWTKQLHLIVIILSFLAGKHTVFGRVSGGIEIVRRIGLVETDPSDR